MSKYKTLKAILKKGNVAVVPTDTVYGIVASVSSPAGVEKIYTVKKRDHDKPPVVLILRVSNLRRFGITLSNPMKNILKTVWPGKVSVIFPVRSHKYAYLHRGRKSLAFRIPKDPATRRMLAVAGPLATSSANTQAQTPARTSLAARRYFGSSVSYYLAGPRKTGKPSTIVRIKNRATLEIVRHGAVDVEELRLQR